MAEHSATIEWQRNGAVFTDLRFSRAHRWRFDGGAEVAASASPAVVKPPMSDPAGVDPEEAFVASLSSCHMLTLLYFAARGGFVVERYVDQAVGVTAKNEAGKVAVTMVTLRPKVEFAGDKQPTAEELAALHHKAHEECFIANSVKTEIRVEPAAG